MTREELFEVMEDIDERFVKEAKEPRAKRKTPGWLKWGALAACLCLVVITALWADVADEPIGNDRATPPMVRVNGTDYMLTGRGAMYQECPEGFVFTGTFEDGDYEGIPYYTKPEMPEHIYLYFDYRADGTMDYVRFVDVKIRGDDYVRCNGQLYISCWSAKTYGDDPDLTNGDYNLAKAKYGLRFEGEAPDGFEFMGKAEFEGYEIVPQGELSCNTDAWERDVWADPEDDSIILVSTAWHTNKGNLSVRHTGFDVYFKLSE